MTITVTGHTGAVTGTSITIIPTTIVIPPTITWCSKTYRQCQGTAWDGSGQCSSCGSYMGTGGVCLALVEIVPKPACTHKCDDSCRG